VTTPRCRALGWTWWAARPPYTLVLLRELSAVVMAVYLALLVVLLQRAGQDAEAYEEYLGFLWHPLMVLFHVVAFAFAVLHTVTWFQLTPKAIVLRYGEFKVPDFFIIAQQYAGWLVMWAVVLAWVVFT